MKVIIEINDKVIDLVSSILIMQIAEKEKEKRLKELAEKMKASDEPYAIDLNQLEDKEAHRQICMGLAMLAIGQELGKESDNAG